MVKTITFIHGVEVPVPGFGAMGISSSLGQNLSYDEAEPVLLKALELGCTFWDTAVSYRAGVNEKLLGDFIRKHNCRDKLFRIYIDGTIERLGFTPDLYYLHRIDRTTPLEESITALDSLRKEGKTKYIGLSECSAATLRKANSIAKIHAVQAEYSAFETLHEVDGLVDTARELDVAYIAYGPLGHGWLVENFPYNSPEDFNEDDYRREIPKFQGEDFYANKKISEGFKELAKRKGCTVTQIALAWVAAQGMIAIPGTTKPSRLVENWSARDIELTEEELKQMRATINELKPRGDRYNEVAAKDIGN
ncbi:aldo/keto reductase [Stachybotrys elegans]|uniref:Aldo/keto reductase n=1 Tax=Stachybotrys elegans TaxID=80388 RepID=A0A8K0WUF8_9HYPO|nr:aldo/keto reductase [Stachybotrys elegans]